MIDMGGVDSSSQERTMAKLSKKAKSIKGELKARKAKVSKQEGKIKKLKKALKKVS